MPTAETRIFDRLLPLIIECAVDGRTRIETAAYLVREFDLEGDVAERLLALTPHPFRPKASMAFTAMPATR